MESSFLNSCRKQLCVALTLSLVMASAAMAESPTKVLAAYLDPYGDGIVTVNDCAIIIITAESRTDERVFRDMIEIVCAARSQDQSSEGRWQGIDEIYIVNRHGEGRLFEGGDQQCDELNRLEVSGTVEKKQYISALTKKVSVKNARTDGQCPAD